MTSSTKIVQLIHQEIVNTIPNSEDVPVYCVVRESSSHQQCDNIIAVYLDKNKANEHKQSLIDSLPARSKHKIYVQTSILGK